jgi:cyclic pyranopterin monophosphate synthase
LSDHHLTHLDERGNARMVDVGAKPIERRVAVAQARVQMSAHAARLLATGGLPKGDAAAVARVAAIVAAKRTSELIPLCHPLPLDGIDVDVVVEGTCAVVSATVRTSAKTGVEMEALTAVTVGALAVWDMVKGVDPDLTIEGVRLLSKTKAPVVTADGTTNSLP